MFTGSILRIRLTTAEGTGTTDKYAVISFGLLIRIPQPCRGRREAGNLRRNAVRCNHILQCLSQAGVTRPPLMAALLGQATLTQQNRFCAFSFRAAYSFWLLLLVLERKRAALSTPCMHSVENRYALLELTKCKIPLCSLHGCTSGSAAPSPGRGVF